MVGSCEDAALASIVAKWRLEKGILIKTRLLKNDNVRLRRLYFYLGNQTSYRKKFYTKIVWDKKLF